MRLIILCTFLVFSGLLSANESDLPKVKVYKNNKEIQFSDIKLWQRQLLVIEVNFTTDEEFSYISVDKLLNQSFLLKYIIDDKKTSGNKVQFNKKVTLYFWPIKTGLIQLIIPAINLNLSGRSIKKLELSPPDILVKPLPEYLPPGFPVGKIKIESQYSGNSILPLIFSTDKLAAYQLVATSSGLDESFIPDYSHYLENSDITRLASNKKQVSAIYNHGYILKNRFTIPMVINSNGLTSFNSFKVFSFDPETAKVISYHYKPDILLSLNTTGQLFLILIVFIILYFFTRFIIHQLQYLLSRRKRWRLIYSSNDTLQLSRALKNLPNHNHKASRSFELNLSNTSLTSWSESWNSHELSHLINSLNEMAFSEQSSLDFSVLKQDIISTLRKHENCIYCCCIDKN